MMEAVCQCVSGAMEKLQNSDIRRNNCSPPPSCCSSFVISVVLVLLLSVPSPVPVATASSNDAARLTSTTGLQRAKLRSIFLGPQGESTSTSFIQYTVEDRAIEFSADDPSQVSRVIRLNGTRLHWKDHVERRMRRRAKKKEGKHDTNGKKEEESIDIFGGWAGEMYGPWSDWGRCSAKCRQRRKRKCVIRELCGNSTLKEP